MEMEQDLVEELRKGDNFIPELSLVAMKENQNIDIFYL